jgi:hypothetical protein
MSTSNGYFEHDQSVIEFAFILVKEYDKHEREQDRLLRKTNPYVSPEPKNRSKQGGTILAGGRKEKRDNADTG